MKSCIISKLIRKRWEIGFVEGGFDALFSDTKLQVHWVKSPVKDRWYADPFILEVTEDKIIVLAEEYRYEHPVGRIAKLVIDKGSWTIENAEIILELDTHLSFPNIIRYNGEIYVYPENCKSGSLSIYKYDDKRGKLVFEKTICDDALWDSDITDWFGGWQLFGGKTDANGLDAYVWDETSEKFIYDRTYQSKDGDFQLAGKFFRYKDDIYCPNQDCSETYGGAVIIKKVVKRDDGLEFIPVKRLESPSRQLNQGMHTLNEYKGVIVVDAKGFNNACVRVIYTAYRWLKRMCKSKGLKYMNRH